jgi:murein DD-endopeptidase MepM/ murein hydrolase activator NlpD
MIESQTELPVQEGGPATIWTHGRQAIASMASQLQSRIRSLPGNQPAERLESLAVFASPLARKSQVREHLTQFLRWIVTGVGDGSVLNRFALHLVVVLLALGVVVISQATIPEIEVLLPTPTPDLGDHTISTPLTSRGGNRLVSNNTALFQAPVPHTTRAERETMAIITYTVQPNDNVWSIAQGFGISAETILWANPSVERSPDLLSVGQELIVLPVDGIYHTIEAGDTVDTLAKNFQTPAEKITSFELNGLEEPYILTPGQRIVIPDGRKRIVVPNYYPMTRVGRPPAGAPTGSGRFAWPTQGLLTQRYWSGHLGIDIGNRTGTPILAADAGYVVLAGRDTFGYGNQVLIDHGNGYQTRYAHLNTVLVKAGQSVQKNQQIGTMGSTGRSTGPHLHFEVIYNGVRRNPLGFLP